MRRSCYANYEDYDSTAIKILPYNVQSATVHRSIRMSQFQSGGRKRSYAHTHFFEVETGGSGKKSRLACKYCSWKTALSASRMQEHLEKKYPNLPADFINPTSRPSSSRFGLTPIFPELHSCNGDNDCNCSQHPSGVSMGSRCDVNASSPSPSELSFSSSVASAPHIRTPTPLHPLGMDAFVNRRTTERETSALNAALLRSILCSGSAFRLVENPEWLNFFSLMRPGYKVPTRYQLSGILDEEYSRVKAGVQARIDAAAARGLTLTTDGWTNTNGDSVINYILCDPIPMFWKTDVCKESHTGKYIAQKIAEVVTEIGRERVSALVTDNARNMQAAWREINEMFDEQIFCIGCSAHGLNLLLKDMLEVQEFAAVLESAKEIAVKVNGRSNLRNAFNGNCALAMWVKTRWLSTGACFESLLRNKEALQTLAVNAAVAGYMNPRMKTKLLADDFWSNLALTNKIVQAVSKWIRYLESDVPALSLIPVARANLRSTFEEVLSERADLLDVALSLIDKRFEFILGKTDVHIAAHILDPYFRGSWLTMEETVSGTQCIFNQCEKLLSEEEAKAAVSAFPQFKTQTGNFAAQCLWRNMPGDPNQVTIAIRQRLQVSPTCWWDCYFANTPLHKIAKRILSIPATSAAVERSFSRQGQLHSKTRNRLIPERVQKSMFLAFNLRYSESRKMGPFSEDRVNQRVALAEAVESLGVEMTVDDDDDVEGDDV